MSLRVWDEHVVPRLTDVGLRGRAVGEMREVACAGLVGRVVEIGFGSGLNVRWYPQQVTRVTAIEPSDVGWQLSQRRRERSKVPIERAGLDGQRLDLPDDSHDSALVTFSLCTIPDPLLALSEARRVVRVGGRLHALEHGLAPEEAVRRWQPTAGAGAAHRGRRMSPHARHPGARGACGMAGGGAGAVVPPGTGDRPPLDLRLPGGGGLRPPTDQRPRRRNPARNRTMTTTTTMIRMVRICPT